MSTRAAVVFRDRSRRYVHSRRKAFISLLNGSGHGAAVEPYICGRRFPNFSIADGYLTPACLERRHEGEQSLVKQNVPSLTFSSFAGTGELSAIPQSVRVLSKGLEVVHGPRTFARWTSASPLVREALSSAAAAASSDGKEEVGKIEAKTKKPDPTPEECDDAVEDLDEIKEKAKEKAKREQEALKEAHKEDNKIKSLLSRTWAILLGVGPALRAIASMSGKDWGNKFREWGKAFWHELQHYWAGTKLLWADITISSRLLLQLANGKSLTRRERQQLTRTTADVFRLVPFAVFIIVPFMEFLLPFALRLFPNMLPSTFQTKMKAEEDLKRKLQARIQYAKFLQDTVTEMAKEVKASERGESRKTAEDLANFMSKVRTGGKVANEDILSFASLFNDELTLDNISRPRLISMSKYMGLQPFGTDAYLRFMLRQKLNFIKEDDKMIQAEGLDSLSEEELRAACRERGMLGLRSVAEMKEQLEDWLDLSLVHAVPSSLLILSRAFTVAGRLSAEEAVQATLSSLPDEVVDVVSISSLPAEDSLSERKRKLEYLKQQDELIKEEAAKEARQKERQKKLAEEEKRDLALEEMQIPASPASAEEAKAQVLAKARDREEELCKLSSALAVLASASSVSQERADFLKLVEREISLYNNMVEAKGTEHEAEARQAYQAARAESDRAAEQASGSKVSGALIDKVDKMIKNLEKELDEVDAKIGDRWRILDRDHDGKVTAEEVAAAATYLRDYIGQGQEQSVQELIDNLAKDKDGKILVEDIVKLGASASSAERLIEEEEQQQKGT